MNKKINICYIVSSLIIILVIIALFALNMVDLINYLKTYVAGTNGFAEAYSLFNEMNRNISVIMEILFFAITSIVFLISAIIITLVEIKFNYVPKYLKVALLTSNFMTVAYIESLLENYGYDSAIFSNAKMIIILTIILMALTIIYLVYSIFKNQKSTINRIHDVLYSAVGSLLAFGIFSHLYIIVFKKLLIIFSGFITNLSTASTDVLAEKTTNTKVIEQVQGYIDVFVSSGTEYINRIVSSNIKIEILLFISYTVVFIVAYRIFMKLENKNYKMVIVLVVLIIILILTILSFLPNLVGSYVLGGVQYVKRH